MNNNDLAIFVKYVAGMILLAFVGIAVSDFLISLNIPEPYDAYIAITVLMVIAAIGAYLLNRLSQPRR